MANHRMPALFRRIRRAALILILTGAVFVLLPPPAGYGFPVPELPEDNLIVNPWFRSFTHPDQPGLDGWTPVFDENGVSWGLSQKVEDPTPDIIVSGKCGPDELYCGTALRWANKTDKGELISYPGLDVYIYQVVNASPADRRLQFFMYWVNHKLDIGEVTIYAGQSSSGPWTEIWKPLIVTQDENPPREFAPGRNGVPWFDTGIMESTLGTGYPFYKIEFHARYPESDTVQGDVGIKITGVYFSVKNTSDPESLSTPVALHNPSVAGDGGMDSQQPTPTGDPRGQAASPSPEPSTPTQPAATATAVAQVETPTAVPTERIRPTPTADETGRGSNTIILLGFLAGMLLAGILLVLFVFLRKAQQR